MSGSQFTSGGNICAVFGCRNYALQKNAHSMYRFPLEKELCRQWIGASRREDLYEVFRLHGPERLYKSYKICSGHFDEKTFRNPKLHSQGLHKGSIPTLNLTLGEPTTSKLIKKKLNKRRRLKDCFQDDSIVYVSPIECNVVVESMPPIKIEDEELTLERASASGSTHLKSMKTHTIGSFLAKIKCLEDDNKKLRRENVMLTRKLKESEKMYQTISSFLVDKKSTTKSKY